MFDNIGGKIKGLAKVLCWIGIIASVISAIVVWSNDSRYQSTIGIGIVVIIVGCVVSWIGSFFTYGFGELIENSEEIKNSLAKVKDGSSVPIAVVTTTEESTGETKTTTAYKSASDIEREKRILAEGGWKCPYCGRINHSYVSTCSCGKNLSEIRMEQRKQKANEDAST